MIKLPEPYAEKDSGFVGEILACCAEGYTKSPNKQAQLRACRDAVIAISKVYRESMPDNIAAVITAATRQSNAMLLQVLIKISLLKRALLVENTMTIFFMKV